MIDFNQIMGWLEMNSDFIVYILTIIGLGVYQYYLIKFLKDKVEGLERTIKNQGEIINNFRTYFQIYDPEKIKKAIELNVDIEKTEKRILKSDFENKLREKSNRIDELKKQVVFIEEEKREVEKKIAQIDTRTKKSYDENINDLKSLVLLLSATVINLESTISLKEKFIVFYEILVNYFKYADEYPEAFYDSPDPYDIYIKTSDLTLNYSYDFNFSESIIEKIDQNKMLSIHEEIGMDVKKIKSVLSDQEEKLFNDNISLMLLMGLKYTRHGIVLN